MDRTRGHRCGDIELAGYLVNTTGPVPLVMDLHVTHDRFGSTSDPSINGHLHYNTTSFMSVIASSSGRLHRELVILSFLQTHRETDRFFPVSGVPRLLY